MVRRTLFWLALFAAALLAGCAGTPSAERRFRQHFQMPEKEVVTTDSARAALLARLPVGTPEQEIYNFLKSSGIGRDSLSSYYPPDRDDRIVCRIDDDARTVSFSHQGYIIYFSLDNQKRLREIEVQTWSNAKPKT